VPWFLKLVTWLMRWSALNELYRSLNIPNIFATLASGNSALQQEWSGLSMTTSWKPKPSMRRRKGWRLRVGGTSADSAANLLGITRTAQAGPHLSETAPPLAEFCSRSPGTMDKCLETTPHSALRAAWPAPPAVGARSVAMMTHS